MLGALAAPRILGGILPKSRLKADYSAEVDEGRLSAPLYSADLSLPSSKAVEISEVMLSTPSLNSFALQPAKSVKVTKERKKSFIFSSVF